MMCPGNSKSKTYEKLLMLNDGTVNWNVPHDDFCQEKHVDIAINQEKGVTRLTTLKSSSDYHVGFSIKGEDEDFLVIRVCHK